MPCQRCLAIPGYHSFDKLSPTLYYTCPGKAKGTSEGFLDHLKDTLPGPWVWILDCRGIKGITGESILKTIEKDYTNLQQLYVVHPPLIVKAFYGISRPFFSKAMTNKIKIVDSTEVVLQLQTTPQESMRILELLR